MRYILMNKNTPILTCEIDAASGAISKILENHNLEYLPVGIGTNKIFLRHNLNEWWKGRSIPASRQGLDIALTEMGIANKDELLNKSFGLSLSDQYWINPNGLLEWSKINFFDNSFSEDVGDILFGNPSGNKELDLSSPDNTSDGWLKKRWKIVGSNRCLIKGGSEPYLQ
ncbi:MAG: excisionase, partial [Oscillospiraceae bacterium]|nr:excisionase [Oscillospiraceae bacterium]